MSNNNNPKPCPVKYKSEKYAAACNKCMLNIGGFPFKFVTVVHSTMAINRLPDDPQPDDYRAKLCLSRYCPNIEKSPRFVHMTIYMGENFKKILEWIQEFTGNSIQEYIDSVTDPELASMMFTPEFDAMREEDADHWRAFHEDFSR